MTADTLDRRIRRAVVQIVDTSPPPPRLDDVPLRASDGRRRPRLAAALIGVALAAVIVVVVAVLATRDDAHVSPTRSAAPVAQLHVEALSTLSYGRTSFTVPAGRVHVNLSGATGHTFTIDAPTTRDLLLTTDAGGPHDATVTLRPGTYTMGSTVPGHREAGMLTTLHVLRRPVQWVTPRGAADASVVLPAMTTDTSGPPGAIGSKVEVLATRFLQGDRQATTLPDVSTAGHYGRVGRTIVAYLQGSRFEITAFRLPYPVSAATFGAGHDTRFGVTTARSRLVYVDDLATVVLVRRDGTVARITKVPAQADQPQTPDGLTGLAEALDRPALSRAVD